jgi:hypothetical protein
MLSFYTGSRLLSMLFPHDLPSPTLFALGQAVDAVGFD